MTNELTQKETSGTMSAWQDLHSMAVTFLRSGLAPMSIKSPEQAMIIAAQGRELGLPFMASMRAIHVIQNKPSLSAQLKLALAMQTGELEDFNVEPGVNEVIARVKRKGRSSVTAKFGVKEATAMRLISKENYEKQAMTMYQWRALSLALDMTFADVILGVRAKTAMIDEADIPTDAIEPVFDETQPTAAQEVVAAHVEYVEARKAEESGEADVVKLVIDIEEKLGQMNAGDQDAMNAQLKKLTSYQAKGTKELKWVELKGLGNVARKLPQWLIQIHKKVKADWEKWEKTIVPKQGELIS